MASQSLEGLTKELVGFWKTEFDNYVKAGGIPAISRRPVAAIVRELLRLKSYDSEDARRLVASQVQTFTGISIGHFEKRSVLLAASESGVWASELTVVAAMLLAAGYKVVIATETGQRPHMLSVSHDPNFIDGPLGVPVVSEEEAALAKRFLNSNTAEGRLLAPNNIVNLGALIRPPLVAEYLKDPDLTLRQFTDAMQELGRLAQSYDALVVAGGSGAVAGFAMNGGLHHLVLVFDRLKKPIVAQCNGVFALAQAIDPATGESILRGRFATTHSRSHEYRRGGWGWVRPNPDGSETWILPGADGNPIIDSEPLVKNALGPTGIFMSPPASPYAVAVDGHIITARTTPDGAPATAALLAILDGSTPFQGRYFISDETGFKPLEH